MAEGYYRKPDEEKVNIDYAGISKQASEEGNWKGGAAAEIHQNQQNYINGTPQANTYKKTTAYDMPNDFSADVNSAIGMGSSPYLAMASNAYGDQKAVGSVDLNQYAGQNDEKVNAYYSDNKFNYDDPYGFMEQALGMNKGIMGALAGYAGSTYSDYLAGPEYQNLADLYKQNGQLAMENTLGTASQMSGGLDSSYAVGAAQQAYNQYMGGLQDAAQAAYRQQMADKASQLAALQGQQKTYLGAYGDDFSRAFDAYRDDDDRQYKWYKMVGDYMRDDRDFHDDRERYQQDRADRINEANMGSAYKYDALAQDAAQAGYDRDLKKAISDAELGYKYYDSNLDAQTALQKANISAASKSSNSGGGQLTPKQQYDAFMKMYNQTYDENWLKQAQALLGTF